MDFFNEMVLRTPLYPLDIDCNKFEESKNRKSFKEAIYLASPHVYEEYYIKHRKSDSLNTTLNKYYKRISSRATPFGLFAGCSIVSWGAENSIEFSSNGDDMKRHTRLDMIYLCELAMEIEKIQQVQEQLLYFPNSSMYKFGNYLRFVEYEYINSKRQHQLNQIDYEEYIYGVLRFCKSGKTIPNIALTLVDDEISISDATSFVHELIQSQVLVSELEPKITGDEFLYQILEVLNRLPIKNEEVLSRISFLRDLELDLILLDTNKFNSIEAYKKIQKKISALDVKFNENRLFQVDIYKDTSNGFAIDRKFKSSIIECVDFLSKIADSKGANTHMALFKKKFYERYDEREIPLVQALDNENGLGYPIINDKNYEDEWSEYDTSMFRLLCDALQTGNKNIDLSEEDKFKSKLAKSNKKLPSTISLLFQNIGLDKDGDLNAVFVGNGGSSAINMLARFGHGSSKISDIIQEIVKYENSQLNDQHILAEIVHLPQSRAGNVVSRPAYREYEIPYLAKSSVSISNQISVDDLYISLVGDRILLKSKKLNKIVIPRLSNSHAYNYDSLPIYYFLSDFQFQGLSKEIFFSWGKVVRYAKYLPEVRYKKIILSRARWNLELSDYKHLFDLKGKEAQDAFLQLKVKLHIPNLFTIANRDREILINTNDPSSLEVFLSETRNRKQIVLFEFLFDQEASLVKDDDGNTYINELLVFLKNKNSTQEYSRSEVLDNKTYEIKKRKFVIGSEWLYFKIYCKNKTADLVLANELFAILSELKANRLISKWFFIRYSDPSFHVRLRLKLTHKSNLNNAVEIISSILEPMIQDETLKDIQTETYDRELERYSGSLIDIAEDWFYYDSEKVISLIKLSQNNEKNRYTCAFLLIDNTLNIFRNNLDEKATLLEQLSKGFIKEFGLDKAQKVKLDTMFRDRRKHIERVIHNPSSDTEIHKLYSIIKSYEMVDSKIVENLKENINHLNMLPKITSDFIHMSLNRVFISQPRRHELDIYYMLHKFYKSEIARLKYGNK